MKCRNLFRCFSTTFSQEKKVPCSAKDYFKIVSNVEDYKHFLPWCIDSEIITKLDDYNFDAKLTINFKIYQDSYISKVRSKISNEVYDISSTSENNSIFKFLNSNWKIISLGDDICQMNYDVDFEFRNILYQQMSSYFVEIVGNSMNKAFEKRIFELVNQNTIIKTSEEIFVEEKVQTNVINNFKKYSTLTFNLIEILKKFYHQKKLNEAEFSSLMEILEKNAILKEFIIQAYNIFIETNGYYKDAEYKLLHYLKDIVLMRKMI